MAGERPAKYRQEIQQVRECPLSYFLRVEQHSTRMEVSRVILRSNANAMCASRVDLGQAAHPCEAERLRLSQSNTQ